MTGDVRVTEILDPPAGCVARSRRTGEAGSAAAYDLVTQLLHGGNGADPRQFDARHLVRQILERAVD